MNWSSLTPWPTDNCSSARLVLIRSLRFLRRSRTLSSPPGQGSIVIASGLPAVAVALRFHWQTVASFPLQNAAHEISAIACRRTA